MNRRILLLVTILLLSVSVPGQAKKERTTQPQIYFTRIMIPTISPNCRVQISRNDISPREDVCNFYDHLDVGTKIALVKTTKKGSWIKLDLSVDNSEPFAIYLDRSLESQYAELFDTILSRTAVELDGSCNVKTKADVITELGFPSELNRTLGKESWVYDITHRSASYCGFDAMTIEFKENLVTSISGIV